jgi:hypothetical protein
MGDWIDVRHATYVGEIDGQAKVFFALCDDEFLEDDYIQESLETILLSMRQTTDRTASCCGTGSPRSFGGCARAPNTKASRINSRIHRTIRCAGGASRPSRSCIDFRGANVLPQSKPRESGPSAYSLVAGGRNQKERPGANRAFCLPGGAPSGCRGQVQMPLYTDTKTGSAPWAPALACA